MMPQTKELYLKLNQYKYISFTLSLAVVVSLKMGGTMSK